MSSVDSAALLYETIIDLFLYVMWTLLPQGGVGDVFRSETSAVAEGFTVKCSLTDASRGRSLKMRALTKPSVCWPLSSLIKCGLGSEVATLNQKHA